MFEEEYADEASIPASVRHLFVANGDKFTLIQSSVLKTVGDVSRVQEGLRKEREDHKTTKESLRQFKDLDPTDVFAKLDRIEELEAAAGGSIDEEKLNAMVEVRLRSKTAPLEREITTLKETNGELTTAVTTYQGQATKRSIHDELRKASTVSKVRDTAIADILVIGERLFEIEEGTNAIVARDNVGITPGITPEAWLTEIQDTRPHWWPESKGAGGRGGKGPGSGNNPFAAKTWNLTEQGKIVRQDPAKATQLAALAGTTVGGGKPTEK